MELVYLVGLIVFVGYGTYSLGEFFTRFLARLFRFKAKAEISGPRPEDFGTTEKSVNSLDARISQQKVTGLVVAAIVARSSVGSLFEGLSEEYWWWAWGFLAVMTYLVFSAVLPWVNRREYRYLDARKAYEAKLGQPENTSEYGRRRAIPKQVKMYVWQRDGGRCVECGSNSNLEYDHIIPVSRGGSNTERNLQLLCESCNRRKGASI